MTNTPEVDIRIINTITHQWENLPAYLDTGFEGLDCKLLLPKTIADECGLEIEDGRIGHAWQVVHPLVYHYTIISQLQFPAPDGTWMDIFNINAAVCEFPLNYLEDIEVTDCTRPEVHNSMADKILVSLGFFENLPYSIEDYLTEDPLLDL